MAKFNIAIFKELCVWQQDTVFIALWTLSEAEDSAVGFKQYNLFRLKCLCDGTCGIIFCKWKKTS